MRRSGDVSLRRASLPATGGRNVEAGSRMMRKTLLAAVLVLSSCYSERAYHQSHVGAPVYEYGEQPASGVGSFGYMTFGWQVSVDYRGDLDLENGSGWRVSVPPLAALGLSWDLFWFVGVLAVASQGGLSGDVGDIFVPLDAPEIWTSGLSGPRPLLSEVSWELTFEGSEHGPDEAFRLLAGLKVATNRAGGTRLYGCGGWTWHWLWLAGRDDPRANGPYAGGGVDLFLSEKSSVGLDGRWHWVGAEGYEETRLLTLELSLSLHW